MPLYRPSRRDLFQMAAAMPGLVLPASMARAQLGAPTLGNPGHFNFTLGEARITVLSDGFFTTPADGLGVNTDDAQRRAFLEKHFLSSEENYSHTNHLYVELGEARVLVDVGSGHRFLDTAGRLMTTMEAAGIDPDAITHVVITHAHPDHIWGIRDDFDEPILPNAEFIIGGAEHAYWMQDDLVNQVPAEMQQFVLGAVNSLTAEGLDWTLAAHDQQIAPGIRVIDTPGHTPGHMSVVVESGGKQLIALGDSMTHAYMNFAHPDWYNSFDMDGETTVATRRHLLDMAATDRMAVLGYHFPFPGVGHILHEGDSYRFIPALWQF